MIIAIDGPAGSGKSTVAMRVAERLGFHYLDTGAMYRAIAFRAIATGASLFDEDAVADIARHDRVSFEHDEGDPRPSKVLIDGDDVTAAIRMPRVDDAVSAVARMGSVREAMMLQQREIGRHGNIVVEGRDIGTVVFPHADLKIYLTASPQERAKRRVAQQAATGHIVDPTGVRESIDRRDSADSTRTVSPLSMAEDAIELDSTRMSIDEVVDRICELAIQRRL